MRICGEFENWRDLHALSGKFLLFVTLNSLRGIHSITHHPVHILVAVLPPALMVFLFFHHFHSLDVDQLYRVPTLSETQWWEMHEPAREE